MLSWLPCPADLAGGSCSPAVGPPACFASVALLALASVLLLEMTMDLLILNFVEQNGVDHLFGADRIV